MPFDPSHIDDNWNHSEVTSNWLQQILRLSWSDKTTPQIGFRFRQEDKSSGRDRVDIALWHDKHVVGCIEVKNPASNFAGKTKHIYLRQALKYTTTRCSYHHGKIIIPIGILTNGKEAIIFKGNATFDEVIKFHTYFDLKNPSDFKKFLQILDTKNWDSDNGVSYFPYMEHERKFDRSHKPNIQSCDKRLSDDIYKIYKKLYDHSKKNKKVAFISTLTLFLLAMLRDCGLYPNTEIKELELKKSKKSWSLILDGIGKILGDDFSHLSEFCCDDIWNIYQDTSWLQCNLATFPSTGLGKAYEYLLKKLSINDTSFYTPCELIDEIIAEIKPNSSQKVLDPTCGSASFLSSILEYIIANENMTDKKDIQRYLETNLYGVDKDWFACQIAKCVLITIYANRIPYYEEERNHFKSPKIHIANEDFFMWKHNFNFDLIVGNPPWGNVDKQVNHEIFTNLKNHYQSYDKYADVCCFIVEKSISHLNINGKFSFVCKHEMLDGGNQKKHREIIWNENGVYIWDYGRYHWFNNSSCTIVVHGIKDRKISKPLHISKHATVKKQIKKYNGTLLGDLFESHEGHITGRDEVYRHIGNKFKRNQNSKIEIQDKSIMPFKVTEQDRTYVMRRNEEFPEYIRKYCENTIVKVHYKKTSKILNIKSPQILEKSLTDHIKCRSDCVYSKKFYEGWTRIFEMSDNNIVLPTYARNGRIRAAYGNDQMFPTSTAIYMYMKKFDDIEFYYTLAFLNSSFAFDVVSNHPEIRQCQAKATVAIKKGSIKKIRIPSCEIEIKTLIAEITKSICELKVEVLPEYLLIECLHVFDEVFPIIAYHNTEIERGHLKASLKSFRKTLKDYKKKSKDVS